MPPSVASHHCNSCPVPDFCKCPAGPTTSSSSVSLHPESSAAQSISALPSQCSPASYFHIPTGSYRWHCHRGDKSCITLLCRSWLSPHVYSALNRKVLPPFHCQLVLWRQEGFLGECKKEGGTTSSRFYADSSSSHQLISSHSQRGGTHKYASRDATQGDAESKKYIHGLWR